MCKLSLEKSEGPEIKLPKSVGSLKKQEFQKSICFVDYAKALDFVAHKELWKILQEMGITDWLQIEKRVQGCISSLFLFNLYSEYIMRNAELEEAQAGIKVAGRNINNSLGLPWWLRG